LAQAAPQQPAVINPPAVVYAATPALHTQALLNYQSSEDVKIYNKSTTKLADELYDLSSANFRPFLLLLKERAGESGWTNNFMIPVDGQAKNLLDDYGAIPMEAVKTQAQTWMTANTRAHQNALQIASCLQKSLTKEALSRVSLEEAEYKIGDEKDGTCLFRVIVQCTALDQRASSERLIKWMANMERYIVEVGYNVSQFNTEVKTVETQLATRGDRIQASNMIVYLTDAYETVPNKTFVNYMQQNKNDHYDGRATLTSASYMQKAENKYKMLTDSGKWEVADESEAKLIALHAKVEKLEKTNKDLTKKFKKNLKKKEKKPEKEKVPAWKKVAPTGSPKKLSQ
jgi:hypothetical protein